MQLFPLVQTLTELFTQYEREREREFTALMHQPEPAVDWSLTQTRSQALKAIQLNYSPSTEQNGKLGAIISASLLDWSDC